MSQFLPSAYWFTFSAVLGILGFIMLCVGLNIINETPYEIEEFPTGIKKFPYSLIWPKLKILFISAIGCFLLSSICLICGWRAPEKLHHTSIIDNEVVIPPEVMVEALSKAIENMPDDIKYKVLTERMK